MVYQLQKLYDNLLHTYGPQGWWPLSACANDGSGTQPTKTGSLYGYHPGDYAYPRDEKQRLEICLGAILTQNTSWPNVEKAIAQLIELVGELDVHQLLDVPEAQLKEAIRPAGYYNQKAAYLREFLLFYLGLHGRVPKREELLTVKGIGEETADSILLYGYGVATFVVDAYTKRILFAHGLIKVKASYGEVQALFHDVLKKDVVVYREYHSLLVEHAKRYYAKKPYGTTDPLLVD